MGGKNTIVMHNTCEDSLLATPLIYDLVILGDLCKRVQIKKDDESEWESFHPVLSLLSYMLKAPLVPNGAPVVNALFTQRESWQELAPFDLHFAFLPITLHRLRCDQLHAGLSWAGPRQPHDVGTPLRELSRRPIK